MNPSKVFVAVPNLGKINTKLVIWLLDAANNFKDSRVPINGIINLLISRPIEVSRNLITNEFLKTDCTHLLMVDSDVEMLPNMIPKWLQYDKDIIGGYVPIWDTEKQHPRFFAYHIKDEIVTDIDPKLGFQQCDMVGTGAIMIKRKVVETIPNPRFRQILKKDGGFRMGEDQYFVHLAKDAGFEVWIDPTPINQRTEINLNETLPKKNKVNE